MPGDRKVVGIDVSKATLDCAAMPIRCSLRVNNDDAGVAQLIGWLREVKPELVVLEASGGYETAAATAVAGALFGVAVVNPRQVRDFAKAKGRLAKTDRIDAEVIAEFGIAIDPQVSTLADEDTQLLQALLARRSQLVGMRTQELNRAAQASSALRPQIKDHIAWLNEAIGKCDIDLTATLRSSPVWRTKDDLLRSMPGIGPINSRMLMACLPELGQLNRQKISALVGRRHSIATAANSKASDASGAGVRRFARSFIWQLSRRGVATRSFASFTSDLRPGASRIKWQWSPACERCS